MKKNLIKGALTISTLLISAVPALPSTISLNLGGSSSTAGANVSGSTVTSFGTSFLGPISGYSESNLYLTYTNSNSTWSLVGTLDGQGGTGVSLLTWTNTLGTIGASTSGVALISGTTTLQSINSGLATALGLSTVVSQDSISLIGLPSSNALGSFGDPAGSPTINGTTYAENVGSVGLNLQLSGTQTATPEPASLFLMGSVMLMAGLFRVRRSPAKPLV